MKKNNKGCAICHNPTFFCSKVGILGNAKKQQESLK
jgi:hypothetical protein